MIKNIYHSSTMCYPGEVNAEVDIILDGKKYKYSTSKPVADKFLKMFSKNRIKAFNMLKGNSELLR